MREKENKIAHGRLLVHVSSMRYVVELQLFFHDICDFTQQLLYICMNKISMNRMSALKFAIIRKHTSCKNVAKKLERSSQKMV